MTKKIHSQPGVCGGRPIFEGTRIEPRHILPLLGKQSDADILQDYPSLTAQDLKTLRLWPQDERLIITHSEPPRTEVRGFRVPFSFSACVTLLPIWSFALITAPRSPKVA